MTKTPKRDAGDKEQRRDEILRRLLKTPPQPRPKRERKESGATKKLPRSRGPKREK